MTGATPEECMQHRMIRVLTLAGITAVLAGCIDHANAPILIPVGNPLNLPDVAHGICVADGEAMYGEAKRQYQLRAQMTGYAKADALEAETLARAAARRQYATCASSQGYRVVYPG
jgi:hypothetical protein